VKSYTITCSHEGKIQVRHFFHQAGLEVLSATIAKQGYLVLPEGATNGDDVVEDPMTVFTPYIYSIQSHVSQSDTTDLVRAEHPD